MSTQWREVKIEDIAESIAMGPFGSDIKTDNFVPGGVPVIRGGNLSNGGFQDEGFVFLTEAKADQLRSANATKGDLIFTHRGTLGQISIIPDNALYPRYVVSQSQMRMTCKKSKVDPAFVYYFFRSPEGQHKLLLNTSQTGVPAISRPVTSLKAIKLNLPTLPEQKAIARVLSSLDDKIELNRRMNATLEAMAQTLFRAWFVDFEPVKAKAAGVPPSGMDAQTAALFPDEFEQSTLGLIPKGWRVGTLPEIANFIKGVSYRSDELRDSEAALVTLKSIARGGGYKAEGLKPFAGRYKPEQKLSHGDVVIAHTDVTQAAEVLGRAARVRRDKRFSTLLASLDLVIVRPKSEQISQEFLYHLLSRDEFRNHAYGYSNGTTVLHLNSRALPSYKCVLPNPNVIDAFTKIVRPVLQATDSNEFQSKTLAQLRDTLLPRLISGRLSVSNLKG